MSKFHFGTVHERSHGFKKIVKKWFTSPVPAFLPVKTEYLLLSKGRSNTERLWRRGVACYSVEYHAATRCMGRIETGHEWYSSGRTSDWQPSCLEGAYRPNRVLYAQYLREKDIIKIGILCAFWLQGKNSSCVQRLRSFGIPVEFWYQRFQYFFHNVEALWHEALSGVLIGLKEVCWRRTTVQAVHLYRIRNRRIFCLFKWINFAAGG